MGSVHYGCEEISNGVHVPTITITIDGARDIVFTANLGFDSSEEAGEFIKEVYRILSGEQNDLKIYEGEGVPLGKCKGEFHGN